MPIFYLRAYVSLRFQEVTLPASNLQAIGNLAPLFILNAICLHIVSHIFWTIVVNLAW